MKKQLKNEKFILIDKSANVSYTCEYSEDGFCMPMEAIEEMKKKMSYDEAILYFFDCVAENKHLKEEIDKLTAESTEWEARCYKLQNTKREAIEYVKHLRNDDKYHLNDGHLRKLGKILEGK